MANTVVLSELQYNNLLNRIEKLEHAVYSLVLKLEKVLEKEPKYGSDRWWEWANKKGIEDLKAGRYTTIVNSKELKRFFDNL